MDWQYVSIVWCLVPTRNVLEEDGHGRTVSLSIHFLLASSIPIPLSTTLSCMYSFTLSFHLTTGLPLLLGLSVSLTYTFFTNYSLFFLSIWSNNLNVFLLIHSTILYFTLFKHLSYTLSLLSPSHLVTLYPPFRKLISFTPRSWLLCPVPCPSV